jgi:Bromodomain
MDRLAQTLYDNITELFKNPVDEIQNVVLGYYAIIQEPIALSNIQGKLDNKGYTATDQFESDFKLMLANCFQYNKERLLMKMERTSSSTSKSTGRRGRRGLRIRLVMLLPRLFR